MCSLKRTSWPEYTTCNLTFTVLTFTQCNFRRRHWCVLNISYDYFLEMSKWFVHKQFVTVFSFIYSKTSFYNSLFLRARDLNRIFICLCLLYIAWFFLWLINYGGPDDSLNAKPNQITLLCDLVVHDGR